LAARAGCVQLSSLVFEEYRGLAKLFLKNLLRQAVTLAEHERQWGVAPEHILSAGELLGRPLWGTGRLYLPFAGRHPYQRTGPDSDNQGLGGFEHEFASRRADENSEGGWGVAERAKYMFINGAESLEEYEIALAKQQEEIAPRVAELAAEEAQEAEESEREFAEKTNLLEAERAMEGIPPLTENQKKDRRLRYESLQLVRKMQKSTDRIIPLLPLARLVMEVGQDFKSNLFWSPVAFNLVGEMLETYLVGVFKDSLLSAIHGKRICIMPEDIGYARRIRGERS